jgi:hypothetical protein
LNDHLINSPYNEKLSRSVSDRLYCLVELSLHSLLSLSHITIAATPRFFRLSAPMLMSAAVLSPPLYAVSLLFITALIT